MEILSASNRIHNAFEALTDLPNIVPIRDKGARDTITDEVIGMVNLLDAFAKKYLSPAEYKELLER
jgi:hypothetical protein